MARPLKRGMKMTYIFNIQSSVDCLLHTLAKIADMVLEVIIS